MLSYINIYSIFSFCTKIFKFTNIGLLSSSRLFHSSKTNQRLTKAERSDYKLSDYLKQVLIGNILGDVYMRRFSDKANTRVVFRQGSKNGDYLLHLYSLFQKFVVTPPAVSSVIDKIQVKLDIIYTSLHYLYLVLIIYMNLFIKIIKKAFLII